MTAIIFSGICSLFIILPIWLYLLYQILSMINATTPMWVAYFIYVPTSLFVSGLSTVIKMMEEK